MMVRPRWKWQAKMAYQYWRNIWKKPPDHRGLNRTWCVSQPVYCVSIGVSWGSSRGGFVGGIPLFRKAFKGLTFQVDFLPPPGESMAVLEKLLTESASCYAAIIVEPLVNRGGGDVDVWGGDVDGDSTVGDEV